MESAERITWKEQDATRLANGVIELIVKEEGGHLAELRFLEGNGAPGVNVLWEAPWRGKTRAQLSAEEMKETAGLTGHGLCLDYFGTPSAEEEAMGRRLHGEAVTLFWKVNFPSGAREPIAHWSTRLPIAQLGFERRIHLGNEESVAYVEEQVTNERDAAQDFDWVQHATFGPPFITAGESTFAVSGGRGLTGASGYAGCSRVVEDREFQWPFAPSRVDGGNLTDLREPFRVEGNGTIATVQLDPAREAEYIVAVNWKLGLGMGYCLRRKDFPWMMLWEENGARQGSPWNGIGHARGMEFGTTPFPYGREDTLRRGQLFETESWCSMPAHGKRTAKYLMFLFHVPAGMKTVRDIEVKGDAILIFGNEAAPALSLPAKGCEDFLAT